MRAELRRPADPHPAGTSTGGPIWPTPPGHPASCGGQTPIDTPERAPALKQRGAGATRSSPETTRALTYTSAAGEDGLGAGSPGFAGGPGALESLLNEVVTFTMLAVPGADGAGVTMLEDGEPDTIVASAQFGGTWTRSGTG